LTQNRGWKCFWGFILFVLTVALLGCIAFYFYFVFSSAIYSRFDFTKVFSEVLHPQI
jgi:hypothetical protein